MSAKSRAAALSDQGKELVAGELFGGERRPGRGRGGGEIRWRVHGQVDQDPVVGAADDHPAERVAVMDLLGTPASSTGRGLQGITCSANIAAIGGGEEVEVFGWPCRKVLCEQGRSPSQQEALAGGQREERPGHLQLEGG